MNDIVKANSLVRQKHAFLAAGVAPGATLGDLNILMWIGEYADHQTGLAWPSFETLARVIGMDIRYVKRRIEKLVERGYLLIHERGHRHRSNRYKLTYKGADTVLQRRYEAAPNTGGGLETTTGPAGTASGLETTSNPAVVVQSFSGSGPEVQFEVVSGPLELSHQPDHKGRADEERVGPSSPPACAGTPAPGGASPASAWSGELLHTWFWEHYPKRDRAAAADSYLSELLEHGVKRSAIEAGAASYAAWVTAKRMDGQYIAAPLNWLREKRWLDDFAIPDGATASATAPTASNKLSKGLNRLQEGRKGAQQHKTAAAAKTAPKPAESTAEKKARLAARRAEREQVARDLAEAKAKQDAERLQVARATSVVVRDILSGLGGSPEDHVRGLVGHGVNTGVFASYDTEVRRSNLRALLTLAFTDQGESSGEFAAVFGTMSPIISALVRTYKAAELERRAAVPEPAPAVTASIDVFGAKVVPLPATPRRTGPPVPWTPRKPRTANAAAPVLSNTDDI